MILNLPFHHPVLLPEVIKSLRIERGGKYIDATFGGGGYAREIVENGGKVLGIDIDENALKHAAEEFGTLRNPEVIGGNFRDIFRLAKAKGFDKVQGVIFDLGISDDQLKISGKGFSHSVNEKLDMRMGKEGGLSAYEVVNKYSRDKLYEIFTKYSEELNSGAIASVIARSRALKSRIETTYDLVSVIDEGLSETMGEEYKKKRIKIMSRIFQAIRIEVNGELDSLKKGLTGALDLLDNGGRLAVVSFHSLEDRIVKKTYLSYEESGKFQIVSRRPIRADRLEVLRYPKSRSAKLRIIERIRSYET